MVVVAKKIFDTLAKGKIIEMFSHILARIDLIVCGPYNLDHLKCHGFVFFFVCMSVCVTLHFMYVCD